MIMEINEAYFWVVIKISSINLKKRIILFILFKQRINIRTGEWEQSLLGKQKACSFISMLLHFIKKLHNFKERCITKWSHWPSVKLQMVLWPHKAYNQLHSCQNFSEVYFTKGTFKLMSKSFQKEFCFYQ